MASRCTPFHVKHVTIKPSQQEKLLAFGGLLHTYNQRINLVSRRTTKSGITAHIQECLAFVSVQFPSGASLTDWGTGGGLPAIPIAIMRPDVTIHAVDSVQKKILAIRSFKRELDLPNLLPWHGRAELFSEMVNYSVSRATTRLVRLWQWHSRVATQNGALYCMKGGDISEERSALEMSYPTVEVKQIPIPETQKMLLQVKQVLM